MGKRFTLRGRYTLADNAQGAAKNLFEYESPDRTRVWRVVHAEIWPITTRATTGLDGKLQVSGNLLTDFIKNTGFNTMLDPAENRSIGWLNNTYFQRDAGTDFITPEWVTPFVMDPDHRVSVSLWLRMESTSDSASSPEREWGYIITLEEDKVDPAESVFLQIKGSGQDLDP